MMSGLSFAVFVLSTLCVHVCGLVCGLYGDVLCSCDRPRDSLWTIHLHIWVPQTLLLKRSCFVHGGCISVIKCCLQGVCRCLIFYSCCAGFCLYHWHRVCCVHVDIRDVFFAYVELPCVNMTDTERVVKLNLAPLCTACTLVWFDFVCILCVLSWPFWISLPERLCRPNFRAFFFAVWFCLHCLCRCLVYILSQIRWLFNWLPHCFEAKINWRWALSRCLYGCLWFNFLDCGL